MGFWQLGNMNCTFGKKFGVCSSEYGWQFNDGIRAVLYGVFCARIFVHNCCFASLYEISAHYAKQSVIFKKRSRYAYLM